VQTIDVDAVIDRAPLSRFQREVFILCFAMEMLDGFDTQAIAFVAPSLAADWKISLATFGPIFSATLLGSMIGVSSAGRLADRYGRRWWAIATIVLFGIATLASAASHTVTELILWRLIAGIGLGGALPNFFSLAAEYAPRRIRSTVIVVTMWGFPLGAVLGGILSTSVIEHVGWRAVLIGGGVAPLLLAPVLLARLPESIRFLALQPSGREQALRLLHRIDPEVDGALPLKVDPSAAGGGGYRRLFTRELALNSIAFAIAMFMSLLLAYLLVNWIPLLLNQSGMSKQSAMVGTIVFNIAGIFGSYLFTRRVDAVSRPLPLIIKVYCASAFAVAAIGTAGSRFWPAMACIFLAGFLLIGIQMTLSAFITGSYPTAVRATAVGWVQAVGRFGSLVGPLAAGALVSVGMLPVQLFASSSIAAILAAAALGLLARAKTPVTIHE
jgi:MFS transporter, AAHS family, 4-hydroxybenzoate transporter